MPPRRPQFPYPDIMKITRRNIPAYIIADLNARQRSLGQSNNNLMGSELINLIHRNTITHLGPDFDTFVSARGKGRPDIILGNRNIHMNYAIQEGPPTTSDHIPITFTLTTSPTMIQQAKMFDYKRADWEQFTREIEQHMDQPTGEELTVNREYVDNNRNFDMQHEAMVQDYLTNKGHRLLPHRKAQAIKLNNDNPLTRPITTGDIKSIIKNFKDKAPGQRGVRKTVMQRLPDVPIAELKTMFNWALSMGNFPTKFKNATMVLITKAGKDPRKVENYRPISLLEIPGKISDAAA
nr:uncharacterized protein LOC113801976 [Penaeus vannamei]